MINEADRNFVLNQEGAGEGLLRLLLNKTRDRAVPSLLGFLMDIRFWYELIKMIKEYLDERSKKNKESIE